MFGAVSESPHIWNSRKTRPRWRVFAVCISLVIAGCTHVRPWRVAATPTLHSYEALNCDELNGEARRIEQLIVASADTYHAGTREKLSVLRGEADAVNAQITHKECHVQPVDLLITRKKHHKPQPTEVFY
jgi:type IV pilus biogenesis protein CpaD/CtpE